MVHGDDAHEWDERYGEQVAMWSGRANGVLVAEAADLTPGRALDVACGEGADAIWLALQGWEVTAVDVSEVALDRARAAARKAAVDVNWVCADFSTATLDPRGHDLVSSQYPALKHAEGDPVIVALLGAVAPGGLLLVVHHDMAGHHHEGQEPGFDHADYVQPGQVADALGDDWVVEVDETRPRADPPPDTRWVDDIVLRARRLR